MAVSIVGGAPDIGVDAGAVTNQTVTLTQTPVAGDVVVLAYMSTRNAPRTVSSVSGLTGATWARAGSTGAGTVEFWLGTGATAAGTITVVQGGGSGRALLHAYLVRGLTATTSVVSRTNGTGVLALTGPSESAANGQIAISAVAAASGTTLTFPSAETPAGWTAVGPTNDGSGGRTAGAYRIPSAAAAAHRTDLTSTSSMAIVTSGILILGDAGAAGTTVNVGQAVVSNTALAVTPKVGATVTTGRATETATALAAAALVGMVVPLGMALETDIARPTSVELITPITVAMGRALEADSAQAVTARVNATVAMGQALEADTALGATVRSGDVFAVGQAVESDEAFPLTVTVVVPPQTDVGNRANGIRFLGYGTHTYEPYVVIPPAALVVHDMVKAQAFEAPTFVGNRVVIEPTVVHKRRTRERLLIGGKDVTVLNGVATPIPEYELQEPFLYGSGSGVIPQFTKHHWAAGKIPRWLAQDKPVVIQAVDVDTNEVVATRYRGFIDTPRPTDEGIAYSLGGKLAGSMALAIKPPPVFPVKQDAGRLAYWAIRGNGVRFTPALGPETGVQIMNTGGGTELEFLTELLTLSQLRDGTMWTVSERPNGSWGMWAKDRETVHATVYFDHAHMAADLDPGERINRVFATAVGPDGRRISGKVYPGLKQGEAPAFPGAMSEGDTGDSVDALINRLAVVGYLTIEAAATGGFDGQVTRAIKRLQDDTDLPQTGVVNLATWRRLFDLGATGYSLSGATTLPMAQRSAVRQWNRTASGALAERNPYWNPAVKRRDRWVDMGTGVSGKQQVREFSRQQLDNIVGDWAGTLSCNLGGLIAGTHVPGTAFDASDIVEAADVKPGMNIWEPHWEGGTLFHVVHSRVSRTSDGRPSVSLTLDTRARDAAPVFEIIKRRQESRRSPSRAWISEYRSSRHQKDALGEWDDVAGLIDKVTLSEGWNVFPVVAGREGTIQRFRLRLIDPTQFGVALFGRKVTAARLQHLIGNPIAGTADKWQKPSLQGWLEDRVYLESWGDAEQPCGFWPGQKTGDDGTATGDDTTGKFYDAGGISYRTFREPVLYVAVYAQNAAVIPAGRIMWNQFEEGS